MTATPEAPRVRRRAELRAVDLDGDLVMMSEEQGRYFGLTGVAASIWGHLEQPRTVDELCELVSREYDVEPHACRADVETFVRDLLERGMADPA